MHDEPADDPDAHLVRRVGSGDAAACAALVDRYLNRLLGVAVRMLGSRADAEDVVQEVFLRTWQHAARWRPGRARFSTWLYRVTLNLCHDQLRSRRPVAGEEALADVADESASAEIHVQRDVVAAKVAAALMALPERQREAILLCYYEELSNIQAAEVLETSVDALESLLARARRALRDLLRDRGADLIGEGT